MLAFDSPLWIVTAIGVTAALRVWMANLVRLPQWLSWALAAVVPVVGLWRMHVWDQRFLTLHEPKPLSNLVMTVIMAAAVAGILYLFDYERARKNKPGIIELIDSALIALLLVFCILRPFVVQAFFIPSESMIHTLEINDRILVNKFIHFFREPRHGEIVVFRAPPWADKGKKDFIKRVVGLPGDHISVHDEKLWRNGEALNEPYLREPPVYNWPIIGIDRLPQGLQYAEDKGRHWTVDDHGFQVTVGEVVVPPGVIMVMGDNRNDSNDGHAWKDDDGVASPFVPRENLLGKAEVIFWPLWRVRLLH